MKIGTATLKVRQLGIRIIKRQFAFALMAALGCAGHTVSAQVQPLTDFKPIETYNELANCSEKDCKITAAQFSALCAATQLYKMDMPSVGRASLQVGMKGDSIVVTIFPDTGFENSRIWCARRSNGRHLYF